MVEKDIVLLTILIKKKTGKFMSGKPVAEQEIGLLYCRKW
jgi:hypothetical protein